MYILVQNTDYKILSIYISFFLEFETKSYETK